MKNLYMLLSLALFANISSIHGMQSNRTLTQKGTLSPKRAVNPSQNSTTTPKRAVNPSQNSTTTPKNLTTEFGQEKINRNGNLTSKENLQTNDDEDSDKKNRNDLCNYCCFCCITACGC